MAAATANRAGPIEGLHGSIENQRYFPVAASTQIFAYTMVSFDATGGAVPAADVAGQTARAVFMALEGVDNTTGGLGDKRVLLMIRGDARMEKGALTAADVGKTVYVVDDQTLSATPAANTRPVGFLLDVSGTRAMVQIG